MFINSSAFVYNLPRAGAGAGDGEGAGAGDGDGAGAGGEGVGASVTSSYQWNTERNWIFLLRKL